ncbi:MAG: carbohydrate ABC transporter permease, partial [Christensenellaceae bacterium]|nr:carbohydrate ABC transporter permease [Christensenellaceae bacterium]
MEKNLDYLKIERNARRKDIITKAVLYTLLTVWAIMVLFPFYWMVMTSFKSYSAYNSEYIPQLYTAEPTMQNFADAFSAVPLARYFGNTLIFTLSTTAIMLIVTVLAAYAFADDDVKENFCLERIFFLREKPENVMAKIKDPSVVA